MKKLLLTPLLFVVLIAAVNYENTIDGTWKGDFYSPDGPMSLTYVFKTDGDTLTGTVSTGFDLMNLEDGKVKEDGENFSFLVMYGEMPVPHTGTLNEDGTITLRITVNGQISPIKLTKAEAEEDQ